MDISLVLMLRGTVALCPDCGDERIVVAVLDDEFCCTTCDAAIFVLDALADGSLLSRQAS